MATNKRSTASRGPGYTNRLYALQGTYKSTPARIDHLTAVSLDWVSMWSVANGGLRVPYAGILRRAMAVYVRHLEKLPAEDARYELGCIKQACTGSTPREYERNAIGARMDAFTATHEDAPGVPQLDTFLYPAHVLASRAADMARLHELSAALDQQLSTTRTKRKNQ